MLKHNEIESPESCFNKAQDNERLFVLLARDPAAPVAIRAWIAERIRLTKNKPGDEQIREAYECASLMEFERPEIEASRRTVPAWVEGMYGLRGLPPSIPPGERYEMLKALAGSLRSQGVSHAGIEEALLGVNMLRCKPPMAEDHVRKIARGVAEQSTASKEALIKFSLFARLHDFPTIKEASWKDIVARFSVAQRTPCSMSTCPGSSCLHKGQGELWSPAVFESNVASPQAVVALSLLVFDVDGAEEKEVTAMRVALSPYQHLIHATHADQPGSRRLRVVVQLARAVNPEEWNQFWLAAKLALQLPGDPACRNISRRYYVPSRPHDADYFFVSCPGVPLDVAAALGDATEKMIFGTLHVLGQENLRLHEQVRSLTAENAGLRREGGMT